MCKFLRKFCAIGLALLLLTPCTADVSAAHADTATLAGERLLFVGDSIAAGWRDTGYGHANMTAGGGWSLRLQKDYYMQVTHAAQPSQAFSTTTGRKRILDQMRAHKYDEPYDIVVLQGGFNDCMGENKIGNDNMDMVPALGTVTATTDGTGFDPSTFSGAFEEFLYYAKNDFASARIGFIITYKTPLSQYGGITNGVRKTKEGYTQQDYIDRQKELCDKWGIPYLDLWDGTASDGKKYSGDIIKVNENGVHFPGGQDNIHLNTAGYDATISYVAQWIADLKMGNVHSTTTTTTKYKPAPTTTTTKEAATTTKAKPVTTTTTTAVGEAVVTTTTTTVSGDTVTTTTTAPAPVPEQDAAAPVPQTEPAPVGLILGIVIGAVMLTVGALVAVILLHRKRGA